MLARVYRAMKNLRDKFKKNINFVQPLYRKVRFARAKHTSLRNPLTFLVKEKHKLDGDDFTIERRVTNDRSYDFNVFTIKYTNSEKSLNNVLPSTCNNEDNSKTNPNNLKTIVVDNDKVNFNKNEHSEGWTMQDLVAKNDEKNIQVEHLAELQDKTIILHRVPDTWLRMYPAPQICGEGICSIIFRCCMCQLGLISFLITWTLGWIVAIHLLEGPNEILVAADFEKEQNQLIIDLATELRQITPVSPKWRQAIEARIQLERKLTVDAVGRGARLHPGHFWSVPGTFLFTIYVMTALGFGAPVPMTLWGRTYTIIYACVAVPIHIYLMVNASTCVVVHVEKYVLRASRRLRVPSIVAEGNCVLGTGESPNCSRNSELLKTSKSNTRKKLMCILNVFCMGRCVPMATFLYYLCGATVFGVLRSKKAWEIIMFPLEFTTSGGLDHVSGHIRIMYGLYVEGAMVLISCALATLRRHSGAAVHKMTAKYRLFTSDNCRECTKPPLDGVQNLEKHENQRV